MPVYIEEPQDYPRAMVAPAARRYGFKWSHLWCDPGDEDELHRIAAEIGLRRKWFQDKPDFPHYDTIPRRARAAINAGAQPMQLRQWIKARRLLGRRA